MALPHLIEIIPPAHGVAACVTAPGSKSVTNRALVLAALSDGPTVLNHALWSEDTQVMVGCLRDLGFSVEVAPDPGELGNRRIQVEGNGGRIPRAGSLASPLELYVANAGTAARFLTALVRLGNGHYRISGVPRMHERPQAGLFDALKQLGYRIEADQGKLPALIEGKGPRSASCRVDIDESSQFASALQLAASRGGWEIEVRDADGNGGVAPYVRMTEELIKAFSRSGGSFDIEPDASAGSYFFAADYLLNGIGSNDQPRSRISVRDWPVSGWQIDGEFPRYLPPPSEISRRRHLGDSIMTAIVLAPLGGRRVVFSDLQRLRVQECERVTALRTELIKCGARVQEVGESLVIEPGPLTGAEIATYDDHRIAMCFATLGLKVPGIRLQDPACVKKTFPNFFRKLAAAPPDGIGADIIEPSSRRTLGWEELYAD